MSPDLIAFLRAWYDWATSGAPEGEPFTRKFGLCPNAPVNVWDELEAIRQSEFADWVYPFGIVDYRHRRQAGTQHECPKRLAWVRARLVEAGEIA